MIFLLHVVIAVNSCAFAPDAPPASAPDDAALRDYLSANGLLNRGLYEMAAADYRRFLAAHSDHEKAEIARYGLAVCLFRTGKPDAAAGELEPLARLPRFTYAAEVGTMLGQCRLVEKQYADAAAVLSRVVRENGDHDLADDAAAMEIEALYRGDKLADALARYAAFVSRWPTSALRPRVEYFCGLARMASGDKARAAECFDRIAKEHSADPLAGQAALLLAQCLAEGGADERAIEQYRRVLKGGDASQAGDAMQGLAALLLRKGQSKEAGRLLDQFIEKQPQSPLMSSAKFLRGRAWFDEGKYDRAQRLFEEVAAGDDSSAIADETAYWLAKCALRKEDFADAARRLGEAIEKHPKSALLPEMTYDRAVAQARGGDDKAAVTSLEQFRKRYPTHGMAGDALYLLAAAEHRAGRFDASRAHCEEFARAYPKHEMAAGVAFLAAENDFLAERYEPAATGYRGFLTAFAGDAQADKAKLRLGTALYRLKRLDDAEKWLSEVAAVAEKDEAFRPAWRMLGDIAFERSAWRLAAERLGKYAAFGEAAAGADEALLKLGLAQQRQGRFDAALRAYDSLLEHFAAGPQRLQAIFERGQTLAAMKKLDEAAEAFERVLSEGGDSRFAPYARNHLGSIALQRGKPDEAAKQFAEAAKTSSDADVAADAMQQRGGALLAAGDYKAAEKALGAFADAHPAHARARTAQAQRAIALSRQNRAAEALRAIDALDHAGGGEVDASLRDQVQYEKAWCLRATGKTTEAMQAYRPLLDAADRGLAAQAALESADMEMRAKRFAAAADLLQRIPTEKGDASYGIADNVREQAAYRRAVCAYELGHFGAAADQFASFIRAFPKSGQIASAGALCGESLVKAGRHGEAVAHLKRVVDNAPDDPACGPALLRLGEALAVQQRWPESRQAFADYLERFGGGALWFQAQFGVGWAEENEGRHAEAMKAYRAVIERHKGPTAARAQFQIGECLFARKKYEQAASELLKVDILYAYPEWSAAALYEAGRCFEKLNKASEARAQFKRVDEMFKQTKWAELARQRLGELKTAALPGE